MNIRRVSIRNFRSIRSLDLPLAETTVLIGPNNAGKTAILEAIRIALTRRWGQKGTGFSEYDVHLADDTCDPKTSAPVQIVIELQEAIPEEWPSDLVADLGDVIQVDPRIGVRSITMRARCTWDVDAGSFTPVWEFLNFDGIALTGRGARGTNVQALFNFLPLFYLEALRDASDEFTSRSQFWGRLLRSAQIPEHLERKAKRIFDMLNRRILAADDRLGSISETLTHIGSVSTGTAHGEADLRIMPLRTWDVLSRAEVIYRCETNKPWLPLARHGQGVQSLSVVFLFKAFVEQLLADLYSPDSSPVLAIEEPETHLHPQASRTLWRHVSGLPGQKIVTTHSPYFVQHVPFKDLRLIRLTEGGTTVAWLKSSFAAKVPKGAGLDAIIAESHGLLEYNEHTGELVAHGCITKETYRRILRSYTRASEHHAALRKLCDESQAFIPDAELDQLDTFARRIRGEILFARSWLLVEGQSEYHLMHGIGTGLGYDLDAHGVAVIDFQNNGSAVSFAALARGLGIPWCVVVDGDSAGCSYLDSLRNRRLLGAGAGVWQHKVGTLEQQMVADGLRPDLELVLRKTGVIGVEDLDNDELVKKLDSAKTAYSPLLAKDCAINQELSLRMPEAFLAAIKYLRNIQ